MHNRKATMPRSRIALVCSGMLVLTASASSLAQDGSPDPAEFAGKRVGNVLYSNNPSELAHARGIEEYAAQFGIEVTSVDGAVNPQKQADQVADFIANGMDAIIFQPVDPAAAVTPIQEAQAAGIPIVTWAIKPGEGVTTPFVEVYEYEQTFQAGAEAAQLAKQLWPDQPLGMVLVDIPTLPLCHDLRVGGFRDGVLSVDPEAQIVAEVDGKGDQLESTTVMEDVISSGRAFNLVVGCNGPMSLGALGALEAAGRGKAVDKVPQTEVVVSIDGSPPEVSKLLDPNSSLMSTVMVTPKTTGSMIGEMLVGVLRGEIGATDPYVAQAPGLVLHPDCAAVNAALREEFYQEEDVPCP